MEIKMMEVRIRTYIKYWTPESIYQFLKQIERQEGFKGFIRVNFEAGEFPEIVCHFNLVEDKKRFKEELSKLLKKKENE